jgi:GcrA cell cycle regulator
MGKRHPSIREFRWTDRAIAELRRLWDKDISANDIAARLGAPSRNAVIGKAHRLGLPKRQEPEMLARARADRAATRQASVKKPRKVPLGHIAWTDDLVARLRLLWAERKTSTEIARDLGGYATADRVNAKANALGLPCRRFKPGPRTTRRPKPSKRLAYNEHPGHATGTFAPPMPPLDEPILAPDSQAVPLVDLAKSACHYAVRDDSAGRHLFCAAPVTPGSSYCAYHHARAHTRRDPAETQEDAA